MQFYLAPLEGITTHVYRRIYHKYFRPMDKYFTPFFVPHEKKGLSTKEKKEILPENNPGMRLVPQIMANKPEGFLDTVRKIKEYGYEEVNLNLGCPSKTVVSKGRGAGFLGKPDELDRFLNEIFEKADVKISVKTRLGVETPEEFHDLLKIYRRYPLEELIIHPRVQKDFYKHKPNLEMFCEALNENSASVCYNGDIFLKEDYEALVRQCPALTSVMLGRGIIRNPALLSELQEEDYENHLLEFHREIMEAYLAMGLGERNTLFKMKELWCYMKDLFPDNEKRLKQIRKSTALSQYCAVAEALLKSL